MTTWRDGSSANRTAAALELADAAALHALQHAPGGTDEVANLRAAIGYQRLMTDMGYYAETYPRMSNSNAASLASGSVYYLPIRLFAGKPVTKILTECSVLGSGMTLMRFGICTAPAVNVALSADVKASFGSIGEKEVAIPYTPSVDGAYLLQVIAVGGTPPQLNRSTTSQPGGLFTGATVGGPGRQAAQSDIPPTGAITYSNVAIVFWMAVTDV